MTDADFLNSFGALLGVAFLAFLVWSAKRPFKCPVCGSYDVREGKSHMNAEVYWCKPCNGGRWPEDVT